MNDQPNRYFCQDGSQTLITTPADDVTQTDPTAGGNAIVDPDGSNLPVTRGHDTAIEKNCHTNQNVYVASDDDTKSELIPEFVFGKWAVYACAVGNFGLSISLPLALSSMFLDWQEAFHESRAKTVTVHSTAVGILFGGAIIPGYMVNRWGARFTVLLGSLLASVGFFASSFATSINFLVVTTGILGGLGFCFIQLPAFPAVTMAFTPKYQTLAVSVCTCGGALMNMGFPFLYRYITELYSWRGAFIFISGLCLQTAVMGLIMTSYVKRPCTDKKNRRVDVLNETESHLLSEKPAKELRESITEEDSEKLSTGTGQCMYRNETSQCEVSPLSVDEHQQKEQNGVTQKHDLHNIPKGVFQRLGSSRWRFLLDYMFILITLNICTCLATVLSFILIMMDFAQTKGFQDESTGVLFLLIVFITSLVGRLLIGPLNMIPYVHSIIIQGIFGSVVSIALMVLGTATDYTTIVMFLVVFGVSAGGSVAIYAKSILDIDSVTMAIYPLALGVASTLEGTFDFSIPILIGFSVDTRGSYTMILNILGGISFVTSLTLVIVKTAHSCRAYKTKKSDHAKSLS